MRLVFIEFCLFASFIRECTCLCVPMPHKRRSITTQRKRSKLAPAIVCRGSKCRSEKRKSWSDDNMIAALKAVGDNQSKWSSKGLWNSNNGLFDRVSGRVIHGVKLDHGRTIALERKVPLDTS